MPDTFVEFVDNGVAVFVIGPLVVRLLEDELDNIFEIDVRSAVVFAGRDTLFVLEKVDDIKADTVELVVEFVFVHSVDELSLSLSTVSTLKLEVVMLSIKFDVVFVDGNSVVIVGTGDVFVDVDSVVVCFVIG